MKSPEIVTPLHYRNSVADIALRATVLSRVRRFLLTRSFSSSTQSQNTKNKEQKNLRRVDRGQRQHRRHRLGQVFEEQFDTDSRGRLGMRELRNLFQVLTPFESKKISSQEIRAFKHVIDLNEDNRVTRDDFGLLDQEICTARLHIQSFNDLISHLKKPKVSGHGGRPWGGVSTSQPL